LYCKNRPACPIWYVEKRKKRHQKEYHPCDSL
jgi:hypothetical protein